VYSVDEKLKAVGALVWNRKGLQWNGQHHGQLFPGAGRSGDARKLEPNRHAAHLLAILGEQSGLQVVSRLCFGRMHHYPQGKRDTKVRWEGGSSEARDPPTKDVKETLSDSRRVAEERAVNPHLREKRERAQSGSCSTVGPSS
jgi:hypothetical protein